MKKEIIIVEDIYTPPIKRTIEVNNYQELIDFLLERYPNGDWWIIEKSVECYIPPSNPKNLLYIPAPVWDEMRQMYIAYPSIPDYFDTTYEGFYGFHIVESWD